MACQLLVVAYLAIQTNSERMQLTGLIRYHDQELGVIRSRAEQAPPRPRGIEPSGYLFVVPDLVIQANPECVEPTILIGRNQ
jgi:hypothetical protein